MGHGARAGLGVGRVLFLFLSSLMVLVPWLTLPPPTVDMTMRASMEPRSSSNESLQVDISPASDDSTNLRDEERGLLIPHHVPLSVRSLLSANLDEETELQTRPASAASSTGGYIATSTGNYIKRKTSQLLDAVSSGSRNPEAAVTPELAALVQAYADSEIAAGIRREMEEVRREAEASRNGGAPRNGDGHVTGELPDIALETSLLRGRKRASWGTQFRILSGRAFKNLYRDPALLAAHYLSAVGLAGRFLAFSFEDCLLMGFLDSYLWVVLPQCHVCP